jgi:hypothetical protein
MKKIVIFSVVSLLLHVAAAAQTPNEKMLFVIDSIPLLTDPEEWNRILQEDIADFAVVRDKDSLKLLGWKQLDGITYIFTKEYRNRPDSIKKIPGLRQMKMLEGLWNLDGSPYTGKYIDYYNSGRILNEGTLVKGKLHGELTVFFKNGNKKSVSNYKDGILHGIWNDYYVNGALRQTREYAEGKSRMTRRAYFIDGKIESEIRPKKTTSYDTSFEYYSTGKVKQMRLIRNGVAVPDKKADDIGYYSIKFYQSINEVDIKGANKSFFKLWQIDSTGADLHFKEGLLMMKEFRFNEAIDVFDRALSIEPLMREALAHRALAAIKKHKYPNAKVLPKDYKEGLLTLQDIVSIPDAERERICKDVQLAKYVDYSEYYLMKIIPLVILDYCGVKDSR